MIYSFRKTLALIASLGIAVAGTLHSASGATSSALPDPDASVRSTYNLNVDWKLFVGEKKGAEVTDFDDATWKTVTLPHAWNEDEAFKKDIHDLSTGVAWYRKHFSLPDDVTGKKVFLEFEGVRHGAEIFVNGKRVGEHENGVMAFGVDISAAVKIGDNVVSVRTDSSWDYKEKATGSHYEWEDKNFNSNYGGIPKNVKLHVAGRLYQTLPLYSNLGTTGVYVYASDFDISAGTAKITAESEVRNELSTSKTVELEVELYDLEGNAVKTFAGKPVVVAAGETITTFASDTVSKLHFWSWGYGYLYDVVTTLKVEGKVVDRVHTRTGFRKTEFANGMVKLNDRALQMKGYGQRTSNEWPALGMSAPAWLSDYSNRLIVEGNGNLVRWMHVTPWKQDVESCDRVGLIESMPAGDAEKDVTDRRWGQRVELMRDAMIYNRNNPSILFYESGNNGVSEEHMREMRALRERFDPHGGRASGSRDMLSSKVAEYGGEMLYVNKSARIPFWAMEYSRDEAMRKYWDDLSPPYHKDGDGPLYKGEDARIYNRNQESQAVEDVLRWYDYWRERPGTGKRVNAGGVNIIFSDTNSHHRGAENYRRSGEVDAMRIPKEGYWAHQVIWDGWVDNERPRIHIIGHWNYKAGVAKPIYVVSSADAVELFLNGKSLGKGERSSEFLFTFNNVHWEAGRLRAVGYAQEGKIVAETTIETAGEPVALRLKSITGPAGLKADRQDVALVEVEVVDADGRRCPTAMNLIDFELAGPAEWRGGIAQGPDNFILAKSLPVECGVNRVMIRSGRAPGKIVVTAKSGSLRSATVELASKPIQTTGGLLPTLAAEGLPCYVGRGPTPTSPSYHVTRNPIEIVSAKAGANGEKAAASFDDDETTAWANNNELKTAWIAYDFAQSTRVDEAVLKLTGWRQKSYPLRITLDGQEVYHGVTPKTLGYVTLPLKPTVGKTLKIELVDAASSKDAFNIVELSNSKENASTGADRVGPGTLSIVEAEFYQTVTPHGGK